MEQPKYFSDAEEALLAVIAESDELFFGIRNVMWEFPLTEGQKTALKNNYTDNEAMQKVVRKLFLPTIQPDNALTQNFDLYTTLNVEGKAPEAVWNDVKAREILIDLVEAHLAELNGDTPTKSWKEVFKITDEPVETYIGMLARNTYLSHIDTTLLRNVKLLAQKRREEDPEAKKKDSNK